MSARIRFRISRGNFQIRSVWWCRVPQRFRSVWKIEKKKNKELNENLEIDAFGRLNFECETENFEKKWNLVFD